MSSPSKDGNTFARTIKLIVANLDKTKEKIQERFLQVDERLEGIESAITSINQQLKGSGANKSSNDQISALIKRIQVLENKIKKIESSPASSVPSVSPVPTTPASSMNKVKMSAERSATIPTPGAPPPASKPLSKTMPSPSSTVPATPAKKTPPFPTSKTPSPGKSPPATSTSPGVPTPGAPSTSSGVPEPSAPSTSSGVPEPSAPSTSSGVPEPSTPSGAPGIPSPKPSSATASSVTPTIVAPKKKPSISIKDDKSEREQLLEALKQLEAI